MPLHASTAVIDQILQNQPPSLAAPLLSGISPNNKPALSRQRDHSACRRPETPLKVRKTRENLKQCSLYADIPPPCVHANGYGEPHTCGESIVQPEGVGDALLSLCPKRSDPVVRHSRFEEDTGLEESTSSTTVPSTSRLQRQKSVSRRMLSKVKQGISGRPKISHPIKHMGSETSLVRRLSGRRKKDSDVDRRFHSFEVVRPSVESAIDETPDFASFASAAGQRSFTDSTVSTAEVLGDSPDPHDLNDELTTPANGSVPAFAPTSSPVSQPPSSPSLHPTPRPPPRKGPPPPLAPRSYSLCLNVPCVDLYVAMDAASVDVHSKRDIWVAVEATVRTMSSRISIADTELSAGHATEYSTGGTNVEEPAEFDEPHPMRHTSPETACGAITTLRLCFKPVQGCLLREVIGQKSVKDLNVGQQCSLFIKLRVPKIRMRDSVLDPDQESLFTELESIVGTLKTEILHVEARYRHSMLPLDNVVTVRHVCKIKRPKTDSRWSIAAHNEEIGTPTEVHAMLARYLAGHYSCAKAVDLLGQYLSSAALAQPGVREIYEALKADLQIQNVNGSIDNKPSVIVTDIDVNFTGSAVAGSEQFSTAPNTPTTVNEPYSQRALLSTSGNLFHDTSMPTTLKLAPPLLTAPRTTIALSTDTSSASKAAAREQDAHSESQDSARQLWRHIRRTSLSTRQQLEEMMPESLSQLEAEDDHLRELRRRALANKRSIGAETLRAWRWEENVKNRDTHGEAPWM